MRGTAEDKVTEAEWQVGQLGGVASIRGQRGLIEGSEQDHDQATPELESSLQNKESFRFTRRPGGRVPACHGPHALEDTVLAPAALLPTGEVSRAHLEPPQPPPRSHPGGLGPDSMVCTSLAQAPLSRGWTTQTGCAWLGPRTAVLGVWRGIWRVPNRGQKAAGAAVR